LANFYSEQQEAYITDNMLTKQFYCVDNPQDLVFFGSWSSDLGIEYQILLKECSNTTKCLPAANRTAYLDNSKLDIEVLMNRNTYQTNVYNSAVIKNQISVDYHAINTKSPVMHLYEVRRDSLEAQNSFFNLGQTETFDFVTIQNTKTEVVYNLDAKDTLAKIAFRPVLAS
jgi:hypothetical protein